MVTDNVGKIVPLRRMKQYDYTDVIIKRIITLYKSDKIKVFHKNRFLFFRIENKS
jgi:hypothetical protein